VVVGIAAFIPLVLAGVLAGGIIAFHRQLSAQHYFFLGAVHVADAEIGYTLRPRSEGIQVLDPNWKTPVKVDRLGFRIPVAASSETVVRPGGIVGIGCSLMFGHGLPAEATVPYLVGDALHVPAYNLGVCGYAWPGSYLLLERSLPVLKPSVVIYEFANFHIERSFAPSAPSSRLATAYLAATPGGISIHPPRARNEAVYEMADMLEPLYSRPLSEGRPTPLTPARFLLLVEVLVKGYRGGILGEPEVARGPFPTDEDFGRFVLGRLHQATRRHGATLVVVYTPEQYGERCSPGFRKAAADLEGADGFVFVDAAPLLAAEAHDRREFTERFSLASWDGHPSAHQNAILATAVARAVNAAESRPVAFAP